MQEITPIWQQMPSHPLWNRTPLQPLYPSDAQDPLQTGTVGEPINTWTRDRQLNPWTADSQTRTFAEVFQDALEQSAGPVAQLAEPVTDMFSAVVDAVKETDAAKTQMEYLLATGQLDNPALLTIASTKAQLSVQLLVQLRNRALDAYNELMRISI